MLLSLILTRCTPFILSPCDSLFCSIAIPSLGFLRYGNEDFVLAMLCFDFPLWKHPSPAALQFLNNLCLHGYRNCQRSRTLEFWRRTIYDASERNFWTITRLSNAICMNHGRIGRWRRWTEYIQTSCSWRVATSSQSVNTPITSFWQCTWTGLVMLTPIDEASWLPGGGGDAAAVMGDPPNWREVGSGQRKFRWREGERTGEESFRDRVLFLSPLFLPLRAPKRLWAQTFLPIPRVRLLISREADRDGLVLFPFSRVVL